MAMPTDKLNRLNLFKTNAPLAQFLSMEEVKRMAEEIARELIMEKMTQMDAEIEQKVAQRVAQIKVPDNMELVEKVAGKLIDIQKGDRGEKGDKGDSIVGPKGDSIVGPMGPRGERGLPGKDGKTPVAGVDFTIPDPIPGKDGKDGSPDSGEDIVKKINVLEIVASKQIDASHIKNLPKFVERVGKKLHRGGGKLIVDNFTSQTDGSTKTFTLSSNPGTSNVLVCSTQFPVIYDPASDYTVSGTTLTLTGEVDAPSSGQTLVAIYTN